MSQTSTVLPPTNDLHRPPIAVQNADAVHWIHLACTPTRHTIRDPVYPSFNPVALQSRLWECILVYL